MQKKPEQQNGNPTLCTLTMLAILLLSVVAAWHLTRKRTEATIRAAGLITEIRMAGLEKLGYKDSLDFALIYSGQKIWGWQCYSTSKDNDGNYRGFTMRIIKDDLANSDWQTWKLNDNIMAGQSAEGKLANLAVMREISFNGGKIAIATGQGATPVQTTIPGNFLPESAIQAAVFAMKEKNSDFKFAIIPDYADMAGKILTTLTLENSTMPTTNAPKGAASKIVATYAGTEKLEFVYWLDSDRKIIAADFPQYRLVNVKKSEVLSIFPQAENLVLEFQTAAGLR